MDTSCQPPASCTPPPVLRHCVHMNSVLLGVRNEGYGLELQAFRSVSRHVGGWRLFRAIATAFLAKSSIGASHGLRCRNDMDIPAYPSGVWKSSVRIILRPLYGLGFQSTKRPSGWPRFSGDMPGWGSHRSVVTFLDTRIMAVSAELI